MGGQGKKGRAAASPAGRGYGYAAPAAVARPAGRQAGVPMPRGSVPQPRQLPAQPQTRMNPYPQKRPAASQAAAQAAPVRPNERNTPCDLHPFNVKTRRLIEHKSRNPHRRLVHPHLVRVIAHWASVPPNTSPLTSQSVDVTLTDAPDNAVQAPEGEEAEPESGIDARVLLCPGLVQASASSRQHVLSRVQIIGRKAVATGAVSAYGGRTTAKSDTDIIHFLVAKVKDQCGLDLSGVMTWYTFVEFQYSPKTDTPNTAFYMPALWELTDELRVVGQMREETVEHIEYIDQDLEREGMTDEEYQEAKSKLEPEKKVTTETKRTMVYTPVRLTMAQCLASELQKGQTKETMELYGSADALDEFLKREMTGRIAQRLAFKAEETLEKQEKRTRLESERAEKKKAIAELKEAKRVEGQAKLEELRAKWEQEDQGKTDDEKKDALVERRRQEDELLNPAVEGEEVEDVDMSDEKKQTATAVNHRALEAFEYFDRPLASAQLRVPVARGLLTVARLEQLLLCSEQDVCLADVESILEPLTAGGARQAHYKPICLDEIEDCHTGEPVADEEMQDQDLPNAAPLEGAEFEGMGEEE